MLLYCTRFGLFLITSDLFTHHICCMRQETVWNCFMARALIIIACCCSGLPHTHRGGQTQAGRPGQVRDHRARTLLRCCRLHPSRDGSLCPEESSTSWHACKKFHLNTQLSLSFTSSNSPKPLLLLLFAGYKLHGDWVDASPSGPRLQNPHNLIQGSQPHAHRCHF